MTNVIRHRGPDDEGFLLFPSPTANPLAYGGKDTPQSVYQSSFSYSARENLFESNSVENMFLGLGHRRLSILDLSPAGHQPMCDSSQRYWVVYNGEIYNHLELREELKSLGHQFYTQCDTEVLLIAYAQWGKACLHRLNGMFSFLLYDRLSQTLFAARDRFGIKPLYYWIAPDGSIAFGSEIKQFTVLPGWQARINSQRIYDFLVWGLTDHTQETCFAGVYQVLPGHSILIDCLAYWQGDGRQPHSHLSSYCWYKLVQKPIQSSFETAIEQVHNILQEAVRIRLSADVPVGSCLSGGVDSSSIVCLMNLLLKDTGEQKTFTACTHVPHLDERQWAEAVVFHTGINPHFIYPELDTLWEILPQLTWHQDEPFGSTSIYAQWSVFRAAKKAGITVMLDGQGADELFCGYHSFFSALLRERFLSGDWQGFYREAKAVQGIHGIPINEQIQLALGALLPQSLQNLGRKFTGKNHGNPNWLNQDDGIYNYTNPVQRSENSLVNVKALSHQQLCSTNLPMLLRWEDRNSMANGIEARVPFLDYRLVELVYNLPTGYKVSGGETKKVLRAALKDVLPDIIRKRQDKLGFVTPEEVWLRQEQPEQFVHAVNQSIEQSYGLLNSSALTITKQIILGKYPFSFLPWRFISLGSWMNVFKVKK
ncbi:asparagine synthase (glutamine-hydrolyzing) [Leptolyngbya sp. SLC-A1]